jgi:hypothetical protein
MPTIASTDKVLVTGANGYIALWIVKTLLERGNSVRGSVRSESKGRVLRELFNSYGDLLEIVVVPDMTKARFIIEDISFSMLTSCPPYRKEPGTRQSKAFKPLNTQPPPLTSQCPTPNQRVSFYAKSSDHC